MKKGKIPTILGILILVAGVALGVYLVQNRQIFKLGASPENTPKDLRITNVTDNSFSVSWTTDGKVGGFVKYGESESSLGRTGLDKLGDASFTHYVTIENLSAEKKYYFKVNSGSEDFDNGGASWSVTTGSILSPPTEGKTISGSVLTKNGSPSGSSLVYVTAGGSAPLSTYTSTNGTFVIDLSKARTPSLTSYVEINDSNTLVQVSVQAGPDGFSTAQIYPVAAKPAPPMNLGETHDFRSLTPGGDSSIPSANVNLPETKDSDKESGFGVQDEAPKDGDTPVSIDSLDEGEVITTTEPEFFGEGPAGTQIVITVESDPITDSVTVGSSGEWDWSPPESLSEGAHTITISWRDAEGILRTLKRTFIVQAAEGPSFESTPSGTTSPSPTATTNPSPSPTSTPAGSPKISPSPTATPEELVDAGSLTPTYLLSIMGLGLLLVSIVAGYIGVKEK